MDTSAIIRDRSLGNGDIWFQLDSLSPSSFTHVILKGKIQNQEQLFPSVIIKLTFMKSHYEK